MKRWAAMSYIEKILQPGETVIYVTGPHWRIYLPALGLFILAIGMVVLSAYTPPDLAMVPLGAAAVLALLASAAWLRGFMQRRTSELAVTDRRVIFKRGLLRRHTIEMNMSKVESVDVDQSVI